VVVDGRSLQKCTLLCAMKQGKWRRFWCDLHTEWWFGIYVKIYNLCMELLVVLQSYDPTTHFETTVQDVLAMYTRITGKVCIRMRKLDNRFDLKGRSVWLYMCLQLVMMVMKVMSCM
jgi:hypothetical protein